MITTEVVQKVKEFHGHMCPGLAIGIRAAEIALREIGPRAEDEELVAVVETEKCQLDHFCVIIQNSCFSTGQEGGLPIDEGAHTPLGFL